MSNDSKQEINRGCNEDIQNVQLVCSQLDQKLHQVAAHIATLQMLLVRLDHANEEESVDLQLDLATLEMSLISWRDQLAEHEHSTQAISSLCRTLSGWANLRGASKCPF